MTLKALSLDILEDQQKYLVLLDTINSRNPYLTLDFLEIFSDGLESAKCLYVEVGDNVILLTGYLRSIESDQLLFDFVSPYGYSGPYYLDNKSITEDILSNFWLEVDKWHKEKNVVSEFIRFSLNQNYLGYNGNQIETMSNIKGRILDVEGQWANFDRKVRKNVNKANSENLVVEIYWGDEVNPSKLKDFHSIYIDTMDRTNASTKFYYTFNQFRAFKENNPRLCAFVFVIDNGITISTEMLLVSDDSMYSFLGGTLDEYFHKRPNDLLKFEAINWARNNRINYFILGGGYGKDDGIFKYKKSFFPSDAVPFYTGRKVVQKEKYLELVNKQNKLRKNLSLDILEISDNSFFPLYRKIN